MMYRKVKAIIIAVALMALLTIFLVGIFIIGPIWWRRVDEFDARSHRGNMPADLRRRKYVSSLMFREL